MRTTFRQRLAAVSVAALGTLSLAGCGSDSQVDPLDDGDPSTPVDQGTVVPDDPNGVGGGAPVDNVDEEFNNGDLGNQDSDGDNNQPSQQEG